MANWVGDLSQEIMGLSLFATSTGVTTDSSAAGASVDLAANVANICTAIQVVGGLAGASAPSMTGKVQESTDGSTNWTDVTGGGFVAVITTGNVQMVPFKPTKRYVRTTASFSGSTNPVAEATTLIYAPRRTMPDNDGGWDTAVAPG